MLVVTNYPQVPIATTNAATDAARVESQQRPPVVPPQESTKGHEERAFNPQHERTAEQAENQARLNERLQGKQQGHGQQQQEDKQQKETDKPQLAPLIAREPLRSQPALNRRDIRVVMQAINTSKQSAEQSSSALSDQPAEFYQAVSLHISSYYQQQSQPQTQPAISSYI